MGEDEDFIRRYTPFVAKVVRQTQRQLSLRGEHDDLMAYGLAGLNEARGRFDPTQNVPFMSFAYYRVRGAILSGAREMSGLSRRAQAQLMAAEAIDERTEPMVHGRTRIAQLSTEQALRDVDDVLARAAAAYTAAIGLGQDLQESPEEILEARERRERLRQAVASLPEEERAIIDGHYAQGRPLDLVTAELSYSRSGGRGAHSRALALLYAALRDA